MSDSANVTTLPGGVLAAPPPFCHVRHEQVARQARLINEQAAEIERLSAQLAAMEARALEAEQRDALRAECLERVTGVIAEANGAMLTGRRG